MNNMILMSSAGMQMHASAEYEEEFAPWRKKKRRPSNNNNSSDKRLCKPNVLAAYFLNNEDEGRRWPWLGYQVISAVRRYMFGIYINNNNRCCAIDEECPHIDCPHKKVY